MQEQKSDIQKLVELQKNKPQKENESGWEYQTSDGRWTKFYYPSSNSALRRMEKELRNPLNWNNDLTVVRNIPPFYTIYISKMKFPDGKIWDSKLRNFIYGKTAE